MVVVDHRDRRVGRQRPGSDPRPAPARTRRRRPVRGSATTFPVRTRDLIGRPVVILHGDDIAQIKDVVGFEITTSNALPPAGPRALIPRTYPHTAPGEAIIVADRIIDYLAKDLAGFGTTVASWRASTHMGAN
jgi:hypothetical protein